ncbi:MAG TPA: DNA-formamidopyrimidine glycosylase [Clostridia bacterium]|nr:DNA-formamidopyrimidine glycosylase [Clostridia bacterium]
MPELPEVETVRRSLQKRIIGMQIKKVKVFNQYTVKYPKVDEFEKGLVGEEFSEIGRKGKYLLLKFLSGNILVVHLRMTGQFLFVDANQEEYKHTQVVFELPAGKELRFVDIRGFGTMHYFKPEEFATFPGLNKLGPDPFDREFDLDWWIKSLKIRKTKIKSLLLDQTFISGLGNIYVDESLYAAKINPNCPANLLTEKQATDLYWAIKDVLQEGIKHRGTTISDYLDAEGRKGEFQNYLKAYGQKGLPCSRCGTEISRIKLGGRSTYFCPRCQGK